jgi:hemoglobin
MRPDIEERADIESLILAFYTKIRTDDLLAYIFDDVARVNWEEHLPIITDFWDTILLQANSYRRNALKLHMDLNQKVALEKKHFDQWLHLFYETVDAMFEGERAELAKQRATGIATVMQIKISIQNNPIQP